MLVDFQLLFDSLQSVRIPAKMVYHRPKFRADSPVAILQTRPNLLYLMTQKGAQNMNETISVIVPVYKAKNYLEKCLDSIIKQTYKDLEIILVDDGSPDDCGEICEQYAKRDSRIIVIHQQNRGVSAARNIGLSIATGHWIMFVDSDDYIDLDLCEYLLKLADLTHADIVQCDAMLETDGKSIHRSFYVRKGNTVTNQWKYLASECWGKLYKKETISGLCFSVDLKLAEDLYFNVQAISRAVCFSSGSEAKYHYVQTKDSLFRSTSAKNSILLCRNVMEFAKKEFSNNCAVSEYLRLEMLRNTLDVCSRIVRNQIEEDMAELVYNMRREIRKELYNILFKENFVYKEKLKFILVAYAWPIYRLLLKRYKSQTIRSEVS